MKIAALIIIGCYIVAGSIDYAVVEKSPQVIARAEP